MNLIFGCYVLQWSIVCSAAGAYRVFSCDGSTGANTIIIAAAEQAYEDGMDIINLCADVSSMPCWDENRCCPLPDLSSCHTYSDVGS